MKHTSTCTLPCSHLQASCSFAPRRWPPRPRVWSSKCLWKGVWPCQISQGGHRSSQVKNQRPPQGSSPGGLALSLMLQTGSSTLGLDSRTEGASGTAPPEGSCGLSREQGRRVTASPKADLLLPEQPAPWASSLSFTRYSPWK